MRDYRQHGYRLIIKKKICSKCKELLSFDKFAKDKNRKLGISSDCLACKRKYANREDVKARNRIKNRKRYLANREEILKKRRLHYAENSEQICERVKKYYKLHRVEILAKQRQKRLLQPSYKTKSLKVNTKLKLDLQALEIEQRILEKYNLSNN